MRCRFAAVVLLLSAASALRADDWPRWRGADGSGLTTETWKPESLARPKLLFRGQVGEGVCSVSIAAGRLFTLGNQDGKDVVSCLAAKTGKSPVLDGHPRPV